MDNMAAQAKKAALDRKLVNVSGDVAVAFGIALFDEFRRRGWLELKEFSAFGSSLFAAKLPVYQGRHYVFPTWDLPEHDFEVGRRVGLIPTTPH